MDSDIEYRDYLSSDREAIIQLLSEGRSPQYRAVKSAVFDWQYFANPHTDRGAPFLVGVLAGKIVAVNGRMPVRIRHKGIHKQAIWSNDFFVTKACRGRGFGRELKRRVAATAEVGLAYGISDMSDPIYAQQGWVQSSEVRLLYFHSNEPRAKGLLKNMATRLLRLAGRKAVEAASLRVVVNPATGAGVFDSEVDDLWRRCADGYESIVERDADYLTWKYRRHPRLAYSAYEARHENRLEGLLIARWDPIESVIVDYCGPRLGWRLKLALVNCAVVDVVARGTARIRCETTDPEFVYALRQCGFLNFSVNSGRFRVRSGLPGDRSPTRGFFLMTGDSDNDCLTGT